MKRYQVLKQVFFRVAQQRQGKIAMKGLGYLKIEVGSQVEVKWAMYLVAFEDRHFPSKHNNDVDE